MKNINLSIILIFFIFSCHKKVEKDTVVPNRPFPHHTSYSVNSIKPNNFTQSELDDSLALILDECVL